MSNVEKVRNVAVDHHHEMSATFEQLYRDMASSRFTNAFTYGRHKIDVALEGATAGLPRGSKLLDVGCGTGQYVAHFRDRGFEATGVEPADGMIEASRRLDASLDIRKGLATSLPFPDATFDFVMAIEVLRYLHRDDVHAALVEMLRVLRPGGVLFVTMVNRYALDGFVLFNWARQRLKGSRFDVKNPHCEFFTPNELEQTLKAAGAVDARAFGRLFAPMRIAYKIYAPAAASLARLVEPIEDALGSADLLTPFSGHLIGEARKPGAGSNAR